MSYGVAAAVTNTGRMALTFTSAGAPRAKVGAPVSRMGRPRSNKQMLLAGRTFAKEVLI